MNMSILNEISNYVKENNISINGVFYKFPNNFPEAFHRTVENFLEKAYSKYKIKCENYIQKNIKNYSIFRLAYVLCDPGEETLIYNVPLDCDMEVVSAEDAGYAFVCAIDFQKKLNKKIYNVSGGDKFRVVYRDYVEKVFLNYGISLKFIASWLMAEKNYCGGYYKDGNEFPTLTLNVTLPCGVSEYASV